MVLNRKESGLKIKEKATVSLSIIEEINILDNGRMISSKGEENIDGLMEWNI